MTTDDLRIGQVFCIPWRNSSRNQLVRVCRVLELLARSSDGVTLADATFAYLGAGEQHGTFDNASLMLLGAMRWAPVMLYASGASDLALGDRLPHGRRVLVARPTELQPLLAIYRTIGACHMSHVTCHMAHVP